MREPQILATSGGMVMTGRGPSQWRFGRLLRYALDLSGAERPRLCYVNTASGDNDIGLRACYGASAGENVAPSHLSLYPMPNVEDVRAHIMSQDVVWVGGGSVANLLAVWRVHGLELVFREAWEAGVVLAGVSAGSVCWHVGGTTDSFGPKLRPITSGLGLLPYGNGVHYDSEPERRPLLNKLVAAGELPLSYATDDGTGLHYVGTELREAVAELPGRAAWQIEPDGEGGSREVELSTRLLES
ncbi:MAG: Type 1 glutamine amidotransferase-like domain-containing protein [Acidimicrobiales bacterium]